MTRPLIRFTVWGAAQSKGSARAFTPKGWTRPIITSANKNLKAWEQTIRTEVQRVMAETPAEVLTALYSGPISITLVFHVPRPKSAPRRVREPTTRPDLDKVVRGAIDPLNGVLFKDDAQIVAIGARKVFAETSPKMDVLVEAWREARPFAPRAPNVQDLPLLHENDPAVP
jgi:Holliday junction resolvase RusA-like endonuclease